MSTTTNIIINGRPRFVTQRLLTRDDLITLAGYDAREASAQYLEIRWRNRGGDVGGIITDDKTFRVVEGAVLDIFYPPLDRVAVEHGVTITFSGPPGRGKTALMQLVAGMLNDVGVTNIAFDWGLDGNPHRTEDDMIRAVESVAAKGTPVLLREVLTLRGTRRE